MCDRTGTNQNRQWCKGEDLLKIIITVLKHFDFDYDLFTLVEIISIHKLRVHS